MRMAPDENPGRVGENDTGRHWSQKRKYAEIHG